jgi:2-oxo-4-hydroxy-4-carboxy-5-ureidoimidazoline decarboxylase
MSAPISKRLREEQTRPSEILMDVKGLSAMSEEEFAAALAGLWEHSPWVVEGAARKRPFASREELSAAMWREVRAAPEERKLALLRAHPDLAGRLARAGALTADSTSEQASLGLDRLSDAEFDAFTSMNNTYRERFDFPFIICVREHTRASIRAAFESRLEHSREEELQIALDEVRKIAEYRLRDRMTE